eukprot:1940129-Prymnesium_polylepis.1
MGETIGGPVHRGGAHIAQCSYLFMQWMPQSAVAGATIVRAFGARPRSRAVAPWPLRLAAATPARATAQRTPALVGTQVPLQYTSGP